MYQQYLKPIQIIFCSIGKLSLFPPQVCQVINKWQAGYRQWHLTHECYLPRTYFTFQAWFRKTGSKVSEFKDPLDLSMRPPTRLRIKFLFVSELEKISDLNPFFLLPHKFIRKGLKKCVLFSFK